MNTFTVDNQEDSRKIKRNYLIIETSYSTFLSTIMTKQNWISAILSGIRMQYYLSVYAGLAILKLGIYCYDLAHARNKNLGKFSSFFRETLGAVLITLAVIGGFFTTTTLGALSPWLFVAGMLVNVLYNLTTAIQNAYILLTKNDNNLRKFYLHNFKSNLASAAFGVLTTLAMCLAMFVEPLTAILSIISACLSGIEFLGHICLAIKERKKPAEKDPIQIDTPITELVPTHNSSPALAFETKNNNDYFQRENRPIKIAHTAHPQSYLLKEIDAEINLLEKQSLEVKNKFFSQSAKRKAEINLLTELKIIVNNPSNNHQDFIALIHKYDNGGFFNHPFQCFGKQKNDVQDIAEATDVCFNKLAPGAETLLPMTLNSSFINH